MLGAAGSRRITSSLVQVITAVIDHGVDAPAAIAGPRIHARLDGTAWVERDALTPPVITDLARRGFAVNARQRAASPWAQSRRSRGKTTDRSSGSPTGAVTVSPVASEPRAGRRDVLALTACAVGLPVPLIVLKTSGLPPAAFLRRHDTLANLSPGLRHTAADILLVPLGAFIVVAFRLTLGLRLLGPFRSILLAFAFLVTGIWIGLAFFAVTIAVLVAVRPLVRALRLPYFGRVSVMLSLVAMLLVVVTLAGSWLGSASLRGVAHFPIVVLCLVSEAVARAIKKEGARGGVASGDDRAGRGSRNRCGLDHCASRAAASRPRADAR